LAQTRRQAPPLKDFASQLGVAVSTVSAWMTGHRFPDEDHLDALSAYTGLPIRCLFCDRTDCPDATLIDGRPNHSVNLHTNGQHLPELATQGIIEEATRQRDYHPATEVMVRRLQQYTGFECIGLRIRNEIGDYPYVAYIGFRKNFIREENSLCQRDCSGHIRRDRNGRTKLECMCGNILRGRFDPHLPFFTEKGSFWTNSTTNLLASETAKDRQSRTRNTCNGEGYESVGLFPMIIDAEHLGLLQFNDHKRNMFSKDTVQEYELAAISMAAFVYYSTIFKSLHEE